MKSSHFKGQCVMGIRAAVCSAATCSPVAPRYAVRRVWAVKHESLIIAHNDSRTYPPARGRQISS
eukprot:1865990-Pleurochrysis_carterae.AAC.2